MLFNFFNSSGECLECSLCRSFLLINPPDPDLLRFCVMEYPEQYTRQVEPHHIIHMAQLAISARTDHWCNKLGAWKAVSLNYVNAKPETDT